MLAVEHEALPHDAEPIATVEQLAAALVAAEEAAVSVEKIESVAERIEQAAEARRRLHVFHEDGMTRHGGARVIESAYMV